jgi:hypothetical protein
VRVLEAASSATLARVFGGHGILKMGGSGLTLQTNLRCVHSILGTLLVDVSRHGAIFARH